MKKQTREWTPERIAKYKRSSLNREARRLGVPGYKQMKRSDLVDCLIAAYL